MLKFRNKNNKKNNQRRVSIQDPSEGTPLILPGGTEEEEEEGVAQETVAAAAAAAAAASAGNDDDDDDDSNSEDPNYPLGEVMFEGLKDNERRESIAADKLSMRLLEIDDDDSETEELILRESLLSMQEDLPTTLSPSRRPSSSSSPRLTSTRMSLRTTGGRPMSIEEMEEATRKAALERLCTIIGISVLALLAIGVALYIGVEFIGPPNMPVGPYELVERQVNIRFFSVFFLGVVSCRVGEVRCGVVQCTILNILGAKLAFVFPAYSNLWLLGAECSFQLTLFFSSKFFLACCVLFLGLARLHSLLLLCVG
jgi:hypothetical protein